LELLCEPASEVPARLVGDPVRLRQVLINLVSNAIKFTERGEVLVGVEVQPADGPDVVLRFQVADTGIGIAPGKQQCIFQPFVQADGSTTRRYGGTGLGLAISTQLVRMMGGEIGVESKPDGGSRFHFTARLAASPAPAAVRPAALAPPIRTLVVDDNGAGRRILASFGERCGLAVETAASGPEALDLIRQAPASGCPFELLLVDADMPEMDGFALAAQVRKRLGLCVPIVILLSASTLGDTAARCGVAGICHHLAKPVLPCDLLETVLKVLGAAPANQEPAAAAATDGVPTPSLAVLLAEDNAINQRVASRLLEKRGHRVTAVADGRKAIEAWKRESFDLILMDVQMPEMDGFQATGIIRQSERSLGGHTPIIAMTAHAMIGDRDRCLEAGMDGYVTKPIRPSELFEAMAACSQPQSHPDSSPCSAMA